MDMWCMGQMRQLASATPRYNWVHESLFNLHRKSRKKEKEFSESMHSLRHLKCCEQPESRFINHITTKCEVSEPCTHAVLTRECTEAKLARVRREHEISGANRPLLCRC